MTNCQKLIVDYVEKQGGCKAEELSCRLNILRNTDNINWEIAGLIRLGELKGVEYSTRPKLFLLPKNTPVKEICNARQVFQES
jgi:hypothetical protein